jgi:hypothetical protein
MERETTRRWLILKYGEFLRVLDVDDPLDSPSRNIVTVVSSWPS